MIVNQLSVGHKAICIMVSLDTYVVDIIPLDNLFLLELFLLTVRSKDNIADPLTKRLNRELVEKSSRGM